LLTLSPHTVFSLGDHRRRLLGPSRNLPQDYFDPVNRSAETDELRQRVRVTLEEELATFFKDNRGQVAIYDANVRWGFLASFPLLPLPFRAGIIWFSKQAKLLLTPFPSPAERHQSSSHRSSSKV
jgi:hypothetical protein